MEDAQSVNPECIKNTIVPRSYNSVVKDHLAYKTTSSTKLSSIFDPIYNITPSALYVYFALRRVLLYNKDCCILSA